MHTLFNLLRRAAACTLVGLLPLAAMAEPVTTFVPFGGTGNVAVFDADAGTGGWVGTIDQAPEPGGAAPLSLVSVVLFTLDRTARTLDGHFEFTTTDLASTLFGRLVGSFVNDDILASGGQFSLDYQVLGGSGRWAGASGFGLSFLDFDPRVSGDTYAESGLLVFAVPTPATGALTVAGLLAMVFSTRVSRRKGRPVN
jgi:hypothetical protein